MKTLSRLEAELTPIDERVLTIVFTRISEPELDRTIEVRLLKPKGRYRRWPSQRGRDRRKVTHENHR